MAWKLSVRLHGKGPERGPRRGPRRGSKVWILYEVTFYKIHILELDLK